MKTSVNIPDDLMLNAKDFMQLLKDQGMVIGPRTVFEENMVNGVPLAQFRERMLRKKLLTLSEISQAQFWGKIGRKAIYVIANKEVPSEDQFRMENGYIKIPRETVKSIAASRGFKI